MTTVISVVFILLALSANFLIVNHPAATAVFGGPRSAVPTSQVIADGAFLEGLSAVDEFSPASDEGNSGVHFVVFDSASILNPTHPLSNGIPTREGLLMYRIQPGDTLAKVAKNFGISLNTILWANGNVASRSLTVGQEIVILPVSGVVHMIQEGETVDSIAGLYGISPQTILRMNSRQAGQVQTGDKLIIPNGIPKRSQLVAQHNLPVIAGYFTPPTTGWNWGQIHPENAVDIANACGTPIYAAAEGLVVKVGDPQEWNGGYGGFVELEHPNGTGTKYGHTNQNEVAVGDYVHQGQRIAQIGNTGNTHGPTGCHLHYEVRGAHNPLAK